MALAGGPLVLVQDLLLTTNATQQVQLAPFRELLQEKQDLLLLLLLLLLLSSFQVLDSSLPSCSGWCCCVWRISHDKWCNRLNVENRCNEGGMLEGPKDEYENGIGQGLGWNGTVWHGMAWIGRNGGMATVMQWPPNKPTHQSVTKQTNWWNARHHK